MSQKIKIFVADDHPVVRDGLVAVLETQDDFQIVGEASNGQEAIDQLADSEADVLLLDLAMPQKDGVAVIQYIQQQQLSVKAIVFTIFDTDERILTAIKAGAKGYLLKGAGRQEIFQAIRIVHQGGSLLQPSIATKLFEHISQDTAAVSPRELEVLNLLGKGLTNQQIGAQLFISERTVKFHVSAILGKLNAHNRTEAVQQAIRRGLIDLS